MVALAKTSQVNSAINTPHDRLKWVILHPMQYLKVVRYSIAFFWTEMIYSSVGEVGWFEYPVPPSIVSLSMIVLAWLTVAYDEPETLKKWPRMISAAAWLASGWLIFGGVYVLWTPIHRYRVEGLQGRYFLPIALLLCVIFRQRGTYPVKAKWMFGLFSFLRLFTIWTVLQRYYFPEDLFYRIAAGV